MTNTKQLRQLIKEHGYTLQFIAQKLGISRYALQMKIDNVREFKASEIRILSDLLDVPPAEIGDIFLATK